MKRVLVLSDLWVPFPGGAERLIYNVSRTLAETMNVVAVTGYETPQRFDGPQVYPCPIGIRDHHGDGWKLIHDWIADLSPEVIVTHHLYAYEFERDLTDSGIPLVQFVLNGRRIAGAALAVYISRYVADECGDMREGDIIMTPPALGDVVADVHGDCIGFIKPIPHKGVRLVYDLADALPDRKFVILRGEWQDLEIMSHMANIEYIEPVDNIRDFYARCRLVLVPSVSEDAGTVAQEATMNGLPCISSNVGGLIETNGGGIKLNPGNLEGWIDAIEALDSDAHYKKTVAAQRTHLASLDHKGTLKNLAERIAAL